MRVSFSERKVLNIFLPKKATRSKLFFGGYMHQFMRDQITNLSPYCGVNDIIMLYNSVNP